MRAHKTILHTKFFYVITIFGVSLGTVSLLFEYGPKVDWVLIIFGVVWVLVLTTFTWEMVTRNERLDAMVHDRTEELENRNRELASMNRQLRELDELKSSLISSVSHELRTPLTSIKSFSEILLDYEDIDVGTRQEFTSIIKKECDRLTRLIEDLLDLAKISSGKIEWKMERVDVESVARHSLATLQSEIERHQLGVTVTAQEGLPPGWSSTDRLIQVFSNLIGNSIKFTSPGGVIEVGLECVEEGSDGRMRPFIRVCIADDGVGIAPEDQERIFERFIQVGDTLTAKPGGTGLGLSISKEIVERSGGRIWVESELGGGSRFYFTVPTEPAAPAPQAGGDENGGC